MSTLQPQQQASQLSSSSCSSIFDCGCFGLCDLAALLQATVEEQETSAGAAQDHAVDGSSNPTGSLAQAQHQVSTLNLPCPVLVSDAGQVTLRVCMSAGHLCLLAACQIAESQSIRRQLLQCVASGICCMLKL